MLLENIDYGDYDFGSDNEEIKTKKEVPVDEMIFHEEKTMYENKLLELGLMEKIGINGSVMLYPKQPKEKKWHSDEYMAMVNRLTKEIKGGEEGIDEYLFVKSEIKEQAINAKKQRLKKIRKEFDKVRKRNQEAQKKWEEGAPKVKKRRRRKKSSH